MTTTTPHARRNVGRLAALGIAATLAIGASPIMAAASEDDGATPTAAHDGTPYAVDLDDPAVYSTLTPRQQAAVDELVAKFGADTVRNVAPVAITDAEQARIPGVFSWFGQEILSWGLGVGLDGGFGALANLLGFGGNDSTMDRLNDALDEINGQLATIRGDLEAIADEVIWNTFHSAHMQTEDETGDIYEAARDVANFEVLGITPTQQDVHDIAFFTNEALIGLNSTLLSDGVGTIPALVALETHTTPVSDTVDQWKRLLQVVDGYRSAYAQGLMTMMWAAQYDDAHGSNWHVRATGRAQMATEKMAEIFDYIGAPYPQQPGAVPWIHSNGHDWALTNADRPLYLDEMGDMMTHRSSNASVTAITDRYRAGSETLREMFVNRDLNLTARWADGHRYTNDGTCKGSNKRHYLYNPLIEIRDDHADFGEEKYGEICAGAHPRDIEDKWRKPMKAQRGAEIEANPTWMTVDLPINPATGMPALMDDESIRAARDGVANLSIERGTGGLMTIGLDTGDYDAIRIADLNHRVRLHQPVADLDGDVGVLPNLPGGAFMVQLGYFVEGQDVMWDERARSTIATNAGYNAVNLTINAN
ncbi:MAG: hypothetical protein AAFY28_08315 [Actinomycetota bacterium]